jgi:hypothetical protein
LSFNPAVAGDATGTVVLYTNDPVTPTATITLNGKALSQYAVPVITSLTLPSISLDDGVASVSINGSNFFPATTVQINGVRVPITSSSNTVIKVSFDPAILGQLGEYPVRVTNPDPGGSSNVVKLTAYHVIPLASTATVFNPSTKLLYAAIPAASTTNPNTIVSIDPVTGAFGTPIPVLNNPSGLALSDDGRYLYVSFYMYGGSPSALQRIDLEAGAVDRTFTLPGSSAGTLDMHAVPGSPTSVVVALSRVGSPVENGAALFNDTGLVQYVSSETSSGIILDRFVLSSDGATFYGYPFGGSFFATGAVSSTGIKPQAGGSTCCDQSSGSIVVSDGTLLYTNSGQVWDPQQRKLLGRYDSTLFYSSDVLADPVGKRTFILRRDYQPDNGSAYQAIVSYNPSTLSLAGVLYFPTGSPGNLTRWNADGFAFQTGLTNDADFNKPYTYSQLLLVRSSLADAPAAASTVTSLSPNTSAAGTSELTLTVNGSGFRTDSSVMWKDSARTTTFVSPTQITAAITAADLAQPGTVAVAVSTDGNVTSGLPFTISGPPLTVSPSALTFSTLTLGTSSSLYLILQNTGLIPISGVSVAVGGADAASFTTASGCGSSLAAGATCRIDVAFAPVSVGQKLASLGILSSAGSQAVALTGTAVVPDFTISPPASTSGTVSSGQSASYNLSFGVIGAFSGTVAMSCSNLPTYASCTFSPASFTLGSAPTAVTLSIATQKVSATAQHHPVFGDPSSRFIAAAGILLLPLFVRRRLAVSLMVVLVSLTVSLGVGGCSSSSGDKATTTVTSQKTPVGTYTVTVNAVSGNVSHSTDVKLIVQ